MMCACINIIMLYRSANPKHNGKASACLPDERAEAARLNESVRSGSGKCVGHTADRLLQRGPESGEAMKQR